MCTTRLCAVAVSLFLTAAGRASVAASPAEEDVPAPRAASPLEEPRAATDVPPNAASVSARLGASPGDALELPLVGEDLVIVGTRSPRAAASLPTTVTVVRRDDLERSAATTVDGVLRMVPSFATFRRSTSLAADPSSQGLSLRGVGPSGVARTLLLDDGVPANDPFGGWITWRAIPRLGLDRVEVAPGGASALYGSFALGGVVALVPRPVTGTRLDLESYGGSFGTYGVAARAEHREGALSGALEAEHADTDGYVVVAPWDRGAVDGRAGARHTTVSGRVAADVAGLRLHAGATFFDEDQEGGTRFTTAGMRAVTGRAGVERRGELGRAQLTLYGGVRTFTQDRARIPASPTDPPRSTEALAASQEVPSTDAGASLLLAAAPLGRHALSAGVDVRRVAGTSREALFPAAPAPDSAVGREGSGVQWTGGIFAQDAFSPSPELELAGALRLDLWRNEDGRIERTLADGTRAVDRFGVRTRAVLSPRLAARFTAWPGATLRASTYRAFRAPTLNELYRPFQVGRVLTASNPALGAETLTGAEAGPELALPAGVLVRAAAFWNELADPITTVTLAVPLEDGATRRRENLGRVRIRGVDAEASWRPAAALRTSLGWTYADARVVSAPGHPDLVGKSVPHDPRHRVAARLAYARPALLDATLDVRWLARAWEDDRNTLPLPAFTVVDVSIARPLAGPVEGFAAVDNLFDRRYLVGRAGVDTVAAPRLVRAGIRLRGASAAR
jgi:iron complex outermembrane recepter protein